MTGWDGLLAIVADTRQQAREQAASMPSACPNDGEPLQPGPDGRLRCPWDGWTP